MSRKDTETATASYIELASQGYGLFVDAYASQSQRALGYWKSIWEIGTRPFASTAVETTVRENFDRLNQIVTLTIGELQTTGAKNAEFAEKFAAHNAKVGDNLSSAMRGLVTTGISNANYVKETATKQFDDLTKRLDEIQTRATAPVSSN
jgi:hypothetical protein